MILSPEQIQKILKKNPQQAFMDDAVEKYEVLRMHCTGENIYEYVEDMKEFMRPGMKETLVNLMRGNRDLVYRVMAPRDKIYTAKGGIEQYNLPEHIEPSFREFLSSVADGLPAKQWIRQQLQKHYDYDPNGVLYTEIGSDDIPYPTIKCICDIYTYLRNGRALEYLILKVDDEQKEAYYAAGLLPQLDKGDKVFRVIDDAFDRLVITKGKNNQLEFNIYSEIPNEFGYVPGMVISDIFGYGDTFDSPLSPSVQLLNSYMFSVGTYNLAYARQAFPKEWMQLSPCPTCSGEKELQGNPCPECKGSGHLPYLRQADVVAVDYRAQDGGNIPNPPMGIVTPAVEALQFMADNGMTLEDYFEYTTWGVSKVQKNGQLTSKVAGHGGNVSNTAYEAQLNEQPKYDQLKKFSEWMCSCMKFIADTCGWYIYRDAYDGCAILGGDRYMIESPDATWDRYTKAVASMAPMAILDSLLQEYIENKYNNNPLLCRKFNLLMQVEPFVHESVAVIWPDQTLPMVTRLEKKYFEEWTSTLDDFDIASVPDQGGADILRGKLRDYVTGKYVADSAQSNQLITNTGEVLNVDDKVKIVNGREKKPEHAGQTFVITDISNEDITLKGGGSDGVFGYTRADVMKAESTKMIQAA
jgi:hypothetical protein